MRKTFLAGLATLLPIAVTVMIVLFFIDLLTAPFAGLVEDLITGHTGSVLAEHHRYLLLILSRLIVLLLFFLTVLLLGLLGRKLAVNWFLHLSQKIFYKIPIVKTVYRITQEVSSALLTHEKKKLFKGVVSLPFLQGNSRVLGLLSGQAPLAVQQAVQQPKSDLQAVFIPTAPHPISGFLVMCPQELLAPTSIESEELFKYLLSCGLYHPGETPRAP